MSLRAEIRNLRGLCAFRACNQKAEWRVETMNTEHLRVILRPHGLYKKKFCQRHAGFIVIRMETDVLGKRVVPRLRTWKVHHETGMHFDYTSWLDTTSLPLEDQVTHFLTVAEATTIKRIWGGYLEQVIIPHAWQPSLIRGQPEVLRYTLFDDHPHSVMNEKNEQLTNWRMRDHDYIDPKVWREDYYHERPVVEIPDEEISDHLSELQNMEDIIQKMET